MFYKNALLVLPQFFFAFVSLSSGQNFYYDLLYQSYNVFFTSLPIIVLGVLDQVSLRSSFESSKFWIKLVLAVMNQLLDQVGFVIKSVWDQASFGYVARGLCRQYISVDGLLLSSQGIYILIYYI